MNKKAKIFNFSECYETASSRRYQTTSVLCFLVQWHSSLVLVQVIFVKKLRYDFFFSAKDGPNILFQRAPNLDSIESALADLPKDVKFLVFQLTGCGILFYAIFYFSSFIATGKWFLSHCR